MKAPITINRPDFTAMRRGYERDDQLRETIIKESRVALKASKQAIYAVHAGDLKKAEMLLKTAEERLSSLRSHGTRGMPVASVGTYNDAEQEYCEAYCFCSLVKENRLASSGEVKVSAENYLSGIADLTGECARSAVMLATVGKRAEVERLRLFVDAIFEQFLSFHFRNSELRKKSDSIKWNLKKIEEVVYDLSVRH